MLNNKGIVSYFNHIFMCLIPKINKPSKPGDFCIISLCNVTLNIIIKTISNRIKPLLNNIISSIQSAFIHDRLTADNFILSYESFHTMNKNLSKNECNVAYKLAMAKAYDIIEWTFISNTLNAMVFPNNMVKTIMNCVKFVSFSIVVNGNKSDWFHPSRAIKQGDSLSLFPSPILFFLMTSFI